MENPGIKPPWTPRPAIFYRDDFLGVSGTVSTYLQAASAGHKIGLAQQVIELPLIILLPRAEIKQLVHEVPGSHLDLSTKMAKVHLSNKCFLATGIFRP